MVLAVIVNAAALWFVLWAARSIVGQKRRRKSERESRELVISPVSGLVFGAMMLNFQAIYQPQVRNMIVEELKEESVDDGDGDGPLGGRTFLEQMRKIRMGEGFEEVTVRTLQPPVIQPTNSTATSSPRSAGQAN